jgi:hypothetical protein
MQVIQRGSRPLALFHVKHRTPRTRSCLPSGMVELSPLPHCRSLERPIAPAPPQSKSEPTNAKGAGFARDYAKIAWTTAESEPAAVIAFMDLMHPRSRRSVALRPHAMPGQRI